MDLTSTAADWQERVQDFSDRWNPMLVREIRRTLKSRAFSISFLLLVITCTIASYILVLQTGPAIRYLESGRTFCLTFLGILSLPLFFVVPYSLFTVCSQEHSEQTHELLSITTLKTEDILWGYLTCGAAHALFYLCALLPFISFSFLLRGLGISEIIGSILMLTLFTLTTMYWGTMLGCCAKGPISRVICSFLTIAGGAIAFPISSSMNMFILSGELGGTEWLGGICCFAFILTPCMVIMYAVARQQLLLIDPILKPYRVMLNAEGEVLKFQPRYHGVYHDGSVTGIPSLDQTPKYITSSPSGSSTSDHSSGS